MKYSKLFGKTRHGVLRSGELVSHQLLTKAGYIRESTAGRYFFLPLGWRVHEKIKRVIKEEMDRAGAQEMVAPVLHPFELWQETNRDNTTGFELMQVTDRSGRQFALGGTAEEMFVDVVRRFQISHKDLPFNIYQFSTKFRDELRARGGLLRVREFVMKDAYSFDRDEAAFKIEYEKMKQTYMTIFKRLGLETKAVEADNGYIGGEYCHELVVEHPLGESHYVESEDGAVCQHVDVAKFKKEAKNLNDDLLPYKQVEAVRGKTMEEGVKLHGLPLWQQLKDVLYKDKRGKLFLAIIRGDLSVGEAKLLHVAKADYLEPAEDEDVSRIGSYPGFISPVGLEDKVTIVADTSLRTVKNMYGGANKQNLDALNMNIDRDFKPHFEGDIAQASDGFQTEDGTQTLKVKRGIEVGNIFQLGYHYTQKMKDAVFVDKDGTLKPYYMGCYGIGLGRTMATIVEKFHDDKGINWPTVVAPYQAHLITIGNNEQETMSHSEQVYRQLTQAGIEVLWDDREESPGKKFADADWIGLPVRLVVSAKTLRQGSGQAGEKVEWKERTKDAAEVIDLAEVIKRLKTI